MGRPTDNEEMSTHHQWCDKWGEVTEGVCMECERLNRLYPPTGDLYYPIAYEWYYPDPSNES